MRAAARMAVLQVRRASLNARKPLAVVSGRGVALALPPPTQSISSSSSTVARESGDVCNSRLITCFAAGET